MSRPIMIAATVSIVLIMLLGACKPAERPEPLVVTKEVYIPIGEMVKPPAELFRTPVTASELPVWRNRTDPKASSCLSAEDEPKQRNLSRDREKRLDGWEQWLIR